MCWHGSVLPLLPLLLLLLPHNHHNHPSEHRPTKTLYPVPTPQPTHLLPSASGAKCAAALLRTEGVLVWLSAATAVSALPLLLLLFLHHDITSNDRRPHPPIHAHPRLPPHPPPHPRTCCLVHQVPSVLQPC